jgi:lipopolysaccharide transport system ATP-binding protein
MSLTAIRVQNLGKQYRVGAQRARYRTLRDTLANALASPVRIARQLASRDGREGRVVDDTIWALRDVSFAIAPGEVVGIIGRNGAGKTTLLKILSRITEPTTGVAEIRGRVGSLLEVGSGFHHELTGRENVYLSAAILGMKRADIDRKFDEIVAFAEVERFLDTPVKHYSSGMHLRLAFAVAAHLEPEILLVDEVLAVGDARFEKKCLGKMQGVAKEGRTVLFVSHNMPAITRLCERTILLDQGAVIADGPSPRVVNTYLNSGLGTTAAREWPDATSAPSGDIARLRAVRVRTEDGRIRDSVDIRESVGLELVYEVLRPGYVLSPYCSVYGDGGVLGFSTIDLDRGWRQRPRPEGIYTSTAWIPGNFLNEGTFTVEVGAAVMKPFIQQFNERDAVAFQVVDTDDESSTRGDWAGGWKGILRPLLNWTTEFEPREPRVGVGELR